MSERLMVLIPVFEGEATVGDVVRGALAAGFPVVVVDDGSTDASGAVAAAAGATVLRHDGNRGKGAALLTGFAHASEAGATGVITLDADGQHDPAEIPALAAAHRACPEALVIGVRRFGEMPSRNRTGNRISTWWISRFAGRPHRDTQSGFRIYPPSLFRSPGCRSGGFATETELILRAAKRGIPLVEVPVSTIYPQPADTVPGAAPLPSPTHFRTLRDTLRILFVVITSPWWKA